MENKNKILLINENKYPNFNLYIDQVIQFMHINYPSIPITKSIVKKHIKDEILFPPIKKKYTKEHLILIVLIHILSESLDQNKLKNYLSPLAEKCKKGETEDLYSLYNKLYQISPDIFSIYNRMIDNIADLSENNLINILSVSLLKSFIDINV